MEDNRMIDTKNASALMTTVRPETIRLLKSIGTDDVFIAQTTDGNNVMCVMPGLSIAAPADVQTWMHQRVTANLTGRCPACDACINANDNTNATIPHKDACTIIGRPKWVAKWLRG